MQCGSLSILMVTAMVLSACGGGGSSGSTSATIEPADTGIISGTVPGTLIEAFGDNGSYYRTESTDNGTSRHPFELEVPSGLGLRLVLTTGEGKPDEVISPIGFRDSANQIHTRLALGPGDRVDLGHIPLYRNRQETGNADMDEDGVLDGPFILDDVGAGNPLRHVDADRDGIDDWNDPDHGGYEYTAGTQDPLDHDDDGIPNMFDRDYVPKVGFADQDMDGLHDQLDDVNPANLPGANMRFDDDLDGDGYHDDDRNHDGFRD